VSVGSEEGLRRAQDLARTFDRVVWLVLLVTVAIAVGAAVLAPSIRSGIVRVGIAATIGALAGWLVVEAIAVGLPDAAATADGRTAISDLTGALVSSLRTIALLLAGIAILASFFAIFPAVLPKRIDGGAAPVPASAPIPPPIIVPTPPARADAPAAETADKPQQAKKPSQAKKPPAKKPPAKKPPARKPPARKPAPKASSSSRPRSTRPRKDAPPPPGDAD
jgi:hypothetical protein